MCMKVNANTSDQIKTRAPDIKDPTAGSPRRIHHKTAPISIIILTFILFIDMITIFYGTIVHTPVFGELEILPNTALVVDSSGSIIKMETIQLAAKDRESKLRDIVKERIGEDETRVEDFAAREKFLFPGFIDTHIHASQYGNIGIGSDLALLEWLKSHTFPLESRFSMENKEFSEKMYNKVISATIKNGTTCASYFTTTDTATSEMFADLMAKHGQRGFVGKVCMDSNPSYPKYEETEEESLAGMEQLAKYCKKFDNTIGAIVTPRFALACLGSLMEKLGKLAKDGELPVQTHISENCSEIQQTAEKFPESKNYADVYDKFGLLLNNTILAHAVHLLEPERQLVKQRQCTISHCPVSNTFITSGVAPIKEYLHRDKINVALGTDLLGGYEKSILGVVRAAVMALHHLRMTQANDDFDVRLTVAEALWMGTMGGAIGCGLKDHVGSFCVGKKFDAQLIDLDVIGSNVDVFDFDPLTLVYKWVFSGDDRNVVGVWCNGRKIHNP